MPLAKNILKPQNPITTMPSRATVTRCSRDKKSLIFNVDFLSCKKRERPKLITTRVWEIIVN